MSRNIEEAVASDEVCLVSELDFFSAPPLTPQIINTFDDPQNPVTPLDSTTSQILFQIEPSSYFIDLANTTVSLGIKIVMPDGSDLPANEAVTTINYPGACVFKECDIRINNASISSCFGSYSMLAYLQALMNFSYDATHSKTQLGMFFRESDKGATSITAPGGFKSRYLRTSLSKTVKLISILHHGIANQVKLLPSMMQLGITLTKHEPEYFLRAAEDKKYKYQITECQLNVRKVELSAAWQAAFEKEFLEKPLRFDLKHAWVKDFTITSGVRDFHLENPFMNNFLPSFVLIVSEKRRRQ